MIKLSQTILATFLLLLLLIPLSLSDGIPQFLIFQGSVKIDGRIAPENTTIIFYLDGTEVANSTVDDLGEYSYVLIQGYEEHYGEPINITINDYEAEQKINYVYPQNIYLNLSTITEKGLKITSFNPDSLSVVLNETENQLFSITYDSGYNDSITVKWYLNDEEVSDEDSYNFTTNYSSAEIYNVEASITDGYLTATNSWELTVNDKNRIPIISEIEDQVWDEDTQIEIDLSDYFSDPDEDVLTYSYSGLQGDIAVSINNNVAVLTSAGNWNGDGEIKFIANDGREGIVNSNIVTLIVNPVEDAPVISDYSPKYNPIIGDNILQIFSISINDPDEAVPEIKWYLDGNFLENSSSYSNSFNAKDTPYNVSVLVTDGFYDVWKEWSVLVSDKPILGDELDGDTTDFNALSELQLSNVENVILEKTSRGKIEFLESLDLTDVVDIGNTVVIENGLVAIDTSVYPQLSKPARITLRGLSYTTIPKIYYDDGFTTNPNEVIKECDFCEILNYTIPPTNNGVVVFEVEHFTTFNVGESGEEEEIIFENLDTCEEGVIGDLELNIKEPNEDDEFAPGEEITIEVKVWNEGDEEIEVEVEAILYNLDEEDEEESEVSDEIEIDEGDSETIEFTLTIPKNIDEDDDYILYVKAYEDEDDNCVEDFVEIDIEREKHNVDIESFIINPNKAKKGDVIDLRVELENFGSKDEEEVYVEIKNSELGLNLVSNKFDLDSEDDITKRFTFEIPSFAIEKSYQIEAAVYFDDGDEINSDFSNLVVLESSTGYKEIKSIQLSGVTLEVIQPGIALVDDIFSVPVKITNNLDVMSTYTVEATNIADWAKQMNPILLTLMPGQSSTDYLYLKTKEGIEEKHSATFNVKSGDNVLGSSSTFFDLGKKSEPKTNGFFYFSVLLFGVVTLLAIISIVKFFIRK